MFLYGDRKDSIWYPTLFYMDALKVEKKTGMGPGFENPHEFKMFKNNRIQMSENIMVKFSCEFDFKPYPFDKHECNLAFYERNSVNNILQNQIQQIGKNVLLQSSALLNLKNIELKCIYFYLF